MRAKMLFLASVLFFFSMTLPVAAGEINWGGDFNFRLRQNMDPSGSSKGFQQYEVELFMDTALNNNVAVFAEMPIYHSNAVDLGNAWADIHQEGELAATGSTGLMIGHFMPWFGYYGYDDNQSWIYGGRATTNTSLVRGQSVEKLVIRDRQIGVGANLKLGSFLFTPQVFNGAGPWRVSGGTDNDNRRDFAFRTQYTLPNDNGVIGAGYYNAPATEGATTESGGTSYSSGGVKHPRDVTRTALFFKFPDVQQAALPDLSLGGKPFLVYGEYITALHKANPSAAASYTTDQNVMGYWAEVNFRIIPNKLVGIVRYDYFDPNTDIAGDQLLGLTPALKLEAFPMTFFTLSYEYYDGGASAASTKNDDRLTLEMSLML